MLNPESEISGAMQSGRRSLTSSKSGAKSILAIIIVVVLLASTIGAFLFVTGDASASGTEVKIGSKVKLSYIGKLPDGRVFDTSIYSVAVDNTTYPKTPLFSFSGTSDKPLELTVGQGGYIKGFEYGILGLKAGQTKNISIPVSLGYGAIDSTKLVTFDLTETVPVTDVLTTAEFKTIFGVDATSVSKITDPRYGWDVWVIGVDPVTGQVTVWNDVTSGSTYKAYANSDDASYGWDITATVSGGSITVVHQLDGSSAGYVKGYDGGNSSKFIVYQVADGKVTINTDSKAEVKGTTIYFVVTILSVS